MAAAPQQLTNHTSAHWQLPGVAPATSRTHNTIGGSLLPTPPPRIKLCVEPYEEISPNFLLSQDLQSSQPEAERIVKELLDNQKPDVPSKRPLKKISFKIRKNASIYRRREAKPLNVVQELTRKYNELNKQQQAASTEKVHRFIKRVNSQLLKRRPSSSNKASPPTATSNDRNPRFTATANTVRAAIAIFEQKCTKVEAKHKHLTHEKPTVPAKTFDVKAIAIRNQEKRHRLRSRNGAAADSSGIVVATDLCNRDAIENNDGGGNGNSDVPSSIDGSQSSADANMESSVIASPIADDWQVVSLPMASLKRCESNYECQKLSRYAYPATIFAKTHQNAINAKIPLECDYDIVLPPENTYEAVMSSSHDEKTYEEVSLKAPSISCETSEEVSVPPLPPRTRKLLKDAPPDDDDDDDYEIPEAPNVDSEKLTKSLNRKQTEPLPPRPSSSASADSNESNYYESIYSKRDDNYESIYEEGGDAKRHSISVRSIQSDQQTNSIYGRSITSWVEDGMDAYSGGSASVSGSCKAASELSGSSDDWVDISDHDENDAAFRHRGKFVLIREPRHQKVSKKNSGWTQQMRDQWNKVSKSAQRPELGDTDSDHHYETLSNNNTAALGDCAHQAPQLQRTQLLHQQGHIDDDDDDFDSFDSDCESDNSFAKNDSGVDMGNTQLPDPPAGQQTYAFTRFAASAGKNVMNRLRRNWSMRKNDISKSISKITKRKSRSDLHSLDNDFIQSCNSADEKHTKTMARRGFLNKFKRSMSISGDIGDNSAKSTFYLTEDIDADKTSAPDDAQKQPVAKQYAKPNLVRPQMPPPPTPNAKSRSQSWYAECGLFLGDQPAPALPRRPNSFWYAEVGLYQSGSPQGSTPSTSSAENSGNSAQSGTAEQIKEQSDECYNSSVKSYDSSEAKRDEAFNSLPGEIQLRLQDEPLYQFYDAAVLDSVCQDSISSEYSEDYEEVEKGRRSSLGLNRPTAMELVAPQRNNVSVARTLWCEIPEVLQSSVLSTLSLHQKKLQEAKFEMLTSEASYLNSLHVLTDYFVRKLQESDLLNEEEKQILCGKIHPVKQCSEKLLYDLEKCWQENILLHGVCDIVKQHAEASFAVYVAYCENQIVLDQTLKRLKERPIFAEFLRQMESNAICQLLTLYSFLMLPMQRITRWPLLIDAILKRLSPQDDEYLSCQYALATLNKIVIECNEGARNMERVTEMRKIASQMEFAKGVPPIDVANGHRWLVRSGNLTQMLNRSDDIKHTFGKRFSKTPVHFFLFNDIFAVAKSKGDGMFIVQHYCSRSYLELNGESLATLPAKDTQGRHLIFLTILENHEEKTVEMLLACSSESDKERWLEALSPPKSENPDETLYECWDCPQVTVMHNYVVNQPDELALTRGDVINVTRKMADGWYHGERIRDGETGWFPANYTQEVANPHVRARNLKQRYRLLAFSENYLKSK